MERVLLINPPSSVSIYQKSKIRAAVPRIPLLVLAVLAAPLIKEGYKVEILNLILSEDPRRDLSNKLKSFKPDAVGITFTTPLFAEVAEISKRIKRFNPKIIIIGGGVHATALPKETLKNSEIDILVIGEGDYTLADILRATNYKKVLGIAYKEGNKVIFTEPRKMIRNLDTLPFPAWNLYEIDKYITPKVTSRKNPVGGMETARGCPFKCTFCNKNIHGCIFRPKSAGRVVEEMEYMLKLGFNEIHIWEDLFTTDLDRAKEICRLILKKKLKFPWNLFTGIRVNIGDQEFFNLAKRAGCYSVSFGYESGNQALLNNVNKGITLEQSIKSTKMAKKAGLETVGFFMFGLPGETEKTMQNTIDFANKLNPDYAKITLLLPFPDTALFDQLDKDGRIKSKDWTKYNFHHTKEVWEHPNLSWPTLQKYYDQFYKKFYLRPEYVLKAVERGIKNKSLPYDIWYGLKTFLPI